MLVEYGPETSAMIAWGSYPMVPWAGRVRDGRFDFQGNSYELPLNLGEHAIHGVGFGLPWRVDSHEENLIGLSLVLLKRRTFRGQVIALIGGVYAVGRYLREHLRDEPDKGELVGFTAAQLGAIMMFALCALAYSALKNRPLSNAS